MNPNQELSKDRPPLPALPPRLLRRLQGLAQKYAVHGLELFIFGSFARGDQRPVSDLDLGVTWGKRRDARVFSRLYWDVQNLPTIRKIELVDFSQLDPTFRQVAERDKIYLLKGHTFDDKKEVA